MHCILVFDNLNDIVFSKCDWKFISHIDRLGKSQGLEPDKFQNNEELNLNFVIQLFSPIVTSQRIMSSQFGNSYTSIQCQDGLNMVFDEFMGFLFVHFGFEDVNWLKRMLRIFISIVQHLCGPDVAMLKTEQCRDLATRLIETWESLSNRDQAVILEALEQLYVNADLSLLAIKALKDATEQIKAELGQPKSHAIIFVDNKFLALYSRELNPSDMLFLSLLAAWSKTELDSKHNLLQSTDSSEEYYSPDTTPPPLKKRTMPQIKNGIFTDIILLSANNSPAASPYVVHISNLKYITLVILYQTPFDMLSISINDAFEAVNTINSISTCAAELEGIKRGMELLEPAMKKLFEAFKKIKSNKITPMITSTIKGLKFKWDMIRKQYDESFGTGNLIYVNSCCQSLPTLLKDLMQMTIFDRQELPMSQPFIHLIAKNVSTTLTDFASFLEVKAQRNFTLGSSNLSINKYLEDFPGLVHFLYLDRVNHRIITPSLDFCSKKNMTLTRKRIWSMIDFSRIHIQEGHFAIMWKDDGFNYAFYLWFEDTAGTPLKPKVCPSMAVKSLPIPGVISGDFYQRLVEICFPKVSPSKIRCYELYCIHMGLSPSISVLEQSRKLAATICDISGSPSNPLDLL